MGSFEGHYEVCIEIVRTGFICPRCCRGFLAYLMTYPLDRLDSRGFPCTIYALLPQGTEPAIDVYPLLEQFLLSSKKRLKTYSFRYLPHIWISIVLHLGTDDLITPQNHNRCDFSALTLS